MLRSAIAVYYQTRLLPITNPKHNSDPNFNPNHNINPTPIPGQKLRDGGQL